AQASEDFPSENPARRKKSLPVIIGGAVVVLVAGYFGIDLTSDNSENSGASGNTGNSGDSALPGSDAGTTDSQTCILASLPAAAPSKTPRCGTTPMTTMNHSVRSPMPNKRRVLITDCLHNRDDFFHALETVRCEHTAPAPKNLDGLADFLVDARIDRITCAN